MHKLDFLQEYEWLGEFWVPGKKKQMFSGVLSYTPAQGVRLKVFISQTIGMRLKVFINQTIGISTPILFGNINMGKVTIEVYPLSYKRFAGGLYGENEFLCSMALFDEHFKLDKKKILACSFRVNNLDEFIETSEQKNWKRHSKESVFSLKINKHCSFELKKHAKGPSFTANDNLADYLFCTENEELYEDLNKAIKQTLEKYDVKYFGGKRESWHEFLLASSNGMTTDDYITLIYQLNLLLAYLMIRPIFITEMCFKVEGKNPWYRVLKSLYIDDNNLKKIQEDKRNESMALKYSDIKGSVENIFKAWIKFTDNDSNLLAKVVRDNIYAPMDLDYMQNYALLVTMLEYSFINMVEKKDGDKKYDHVINSYALGKMQELFLDILPKGTGQKKIGATLGKIRDCIVHPQMLEQQAFKKFKNCMKPSPLSNLCELIFCVLIIAVYDHIGIDKRVIKRLQDEPPIRSEFSDI